MSAEFGIVLQDVPCGMLSGSDSEVRDQREQDLYMRLNRLHLAVSLTSGSVWK
jgi:hypothetical protein